MNAAQRRAVKRITRVLLDEQQCLVNSYTNLIGPNVGEITEAPILREIRAIEAFFVAFGIEHEKTSKLCADEAARFEKR